MKRFLLILLFLNAIVCTYSQISFLGKINTETGAPLKDVQINAAEERHYRSAGVY